MKQFGNNAVFKRILFRPEPMMIPAGTGTFLKSGRNSGTCLATISFSVLSEGYRVDCNTCLYGMRM